MNWQNFLRLALQNATYAIQLLEFLPIGNGPAKAALIVVINHVSQHADCITELVEELTKVLPFGSDGEGIAYPESLAPIAQEITTLRAAQSSEV